MFAYGTDECPRADLVTGPGNVYVAAAKRLLKGVIGIDAEAARRRSRSWPTAPPTRCTSPPT